LAGCPSHWLQVFIEQVLFLQRDFLREENAELRHDLASVVDRGRPLLGDVVLREPQQLEQGVIVRENLACLCHFAELTVEIFNRVVRVDDGEAGQGI